MEATHGLAPGRKAELQAPKTSHHKPLANLGELSVDLSGADLSKNKNLQPILNKVNEKRKEKEGTKKIADKIKKVQGDNPPKQNYTTTAKPKEGEANKSRESLTRKKTSETKKKANQDLPKKPVKEKPLPPPVRFIDDDDDDEIEVIAPQDKQHRNLKFPGHKSAQEPQQSKKIKKTPTREVNARPPPPPTKRPKGTRGKKKTKKTHRPPRGGRDRNRKENN